MRWTGPYKACHTGKDDPPYVYSVEGPGQGLGYHSWYLFPENTFETYEMAERVARLMNLSFHEGQRRRAKDIRALLDD